MIRSSSRQLFSKTTERRNAWDGGRDIPGHVKLGGPLLVAVRHGALYLSGPLWDRMSRDPQTHGEMSMDNQMPSIHFPRS